MLMDLFFEAAPAARKRRAHFHAFMAEVHGHIGAWRQGDGAARKDRFGRSRGDDPIVPTAALIASQARLLCLDELQVTDIADAMILGRLFEALFAQGVSLTATSNRAPDQLYEGGINRQLFTPFIDMLKARMQIVEVGGPVDFRLDRLRGARVYFSPIDDAARAGFEALWRRLLGDDQETGASLEVQGRSLRLPRAAGGLLRMGFEDLCGRPLGAGDYLAIAEQFHTVFLEGVPAMAADQRNEARRLVTLIDALYEAGAKLVVLAEAEPAGLYTAGEGAFEFARTASRLEEMRSARLCGTAAGLIARPRVDTPIDRSKTRPRPGAAWPRRARRQEDRVSWLRSGPTRPLPTPRWRPGARGIGRCRRTFRCGAGMSPCGPRSCTGPPASRSTAAP